MPIGYFSMGIFFKMYTIYRKVYFFHMNKSIDKLRKIIKEELLKEAFGETWERLHDIVEKMGGHESALDAFVRYFDDSKINDVLDQIEKDYELNYEEEESEEETSNWVDDSPVKQFDKLGDLGQLSLNEEEPIMQTPPVSQPKSKKVIFDKSSGNPWEVEFSERGFLIGDTRMSFEELEYAISKNYTITLGGGKGVSLDAVKMQKILKYKDLY